MGDLETPGLPTDLDTLLEGVEVMMGSSFAVGLREAIVSEIGTGLSVGYESAMRAKW